MPKLTEKEIHARCEAYEECVLHLEMAWTDDPTERKQGQELTKILDKHREAWLKRIGWMRKEPNA